MKRQIRFIRKVLDSLPPCPPDHGSKELEFTSLEAPPGLRFVVSKRGVKSWLLRYSMPGGRKRAVKLGAYPGLEPPEAISTCLEMRGLIAKGIDPQEQRKHIEQKDIILDRFFREEYFPNAQNLRDVKPRAPYGDRGQENDMKLNAFAATTISPFFRSLSLEISGFCERRLTGVEAKSPNRPQPACQEMSPKADVSNSNRLPFRPIIELNFR